MLFYCTTNCCLGEEVRHKEKMEKELASKKAPAPVMVPYREKVAEQPKISSLIDKHSANLGNKGTQWGSLVLGFRWIIPKVEVISHQMAFWNPRYVIKLLNMGNKSIPFPGAIYCNREGFIKSPRCRGQELCTSGATTNKSLES